MGRAQSFPLRLSDTVTKKFAEDEPEADIPILRVDDEVTGPLPPRLVITRDGKTLADCALTGKKTLIGRSDFADIVIDDEFVSKLHVVLLLYSDALVLLDLNSANCTIVNSVKVGTTILQDNDIIALGNHRLKVKNAPAISDEMHKLLQAPDTIKMKNLIDMRRLRARRLAIVETSRKKQG
jgi:pSer/pThr/pTyr-binding forkhead associated (FHA) protein